LVPAFERLLAQAGGDLPRFYAEVRRLAALPAAERAEALVPHTTASAAVRSEDYHGKRPAEAR
jgi:predicted aminopeptidase